MSTSGTANFNPSFGEIGIYAFNLIGIRPTEILQEHMQSLRMAANMLLSRWNAKSPNLWEVSLFTQPLSAGVSSYSYDPAIVTLLDTYISILNTDGSTTDRLILPVTRTEYASYPNKSMEGFPTVYWADRLLAPNITLWPVPDGTQTYLKYYYVNQIQDAALQNGAQLDLPNYFLEPFALGLAARLAMIWAPSMATAMKAAADEAYAIAYDQNTEAGDVFISPMISGYWRT